MGISHKSNGRKSDKETQSPMLKIFKDIMQKDTIQQEKVTLLKDKKKDKKKKLYSESRSKSDPRSYASSSTDRYKTNKQANITVQDILKEGEDYEFDRSRSDALRGGVKESWWFWKDFKKKNNARKGRKTDDTCSCVSCALKKIISSECTCVFLLVLLFSVSVVIAFLLIFKGDSCYDMKQLIKRQQPEGYGTERIQWDRQLNSLDSVSDILDNNGNNYKTSYLNDMNAELTGDLATILDTQKIDSLTSEKLRDFYQKLVQTDVKIKKLKQDVNHYYQNDKLNSFTERFKRCLKNRFNNHHLRALDGKKKSKDKFKRYLIRDKKRSLGDRYNVTGYIIEEEKVVVQYEPGRKRNFPKCAHSHETKSHEKKLKHPFYKHSQRIDEMLKYENPEIRKFTYNLIQKDVQTTSKQTKNKMGLIDYKVYDEKPDLHTEKVKKTTKAKIDTETTIDLDNLLSTTPLYDAALSVSTYINPWEGRSNFEPLISTKNRIGYRKLMGVDEEDDEELNYDLKEVLNDDQHGRDLLDRPVEKKKRESDAQLPTNYKYYPSSKILNPNWKGPMPFYPDEINAMIKHAAIQNYNIKIPINTKDIKTQRDKVKKDVSDTEYIEDYANNKFNKMVKMAQAYSDYGVVYNKKDEDIKDKINRPENRFKQSLERHFDKTDLLTKTTCSCPSEGIRFEYRKGNIGNEQEQLIKDITKHIKIIKYPMHDDHSTTFQSMNVDYTNMHSSRNYKIPTNRDAKESTKSNKKLFFVLRKGSRSLKSIDIIDESRENTSISSDLNQTSNHNITNLDSVFSFLALMGQWFRTLSNLSGESNGLIGNSTTINITQVNSTMLKNKRLGASSSSDVLYPSYDSDMVDNIGHKSRVLMSVGENNTDEKSHTKHDKHDIENSSQSDLDNIVPIALMLAANAPNVSKNNNTSKISNMTNIVKRSVDDSKLVFWNDIYDDNEYGLKLDYADKIREKHLVNSKGVIQKSKDWVQEKIYNITGKVKNKLKPKNNQKTVKCKKTKLKSKLDPSKPKQRKIRNPDENPEISVKKSFAALNENMKRVCQQAAKAVQNTRNLEVRDDNKESAAATSLMQQLVRLMTDLVEIQVQQKTCTKLPPDLQKFLEWLTTQEENNLNMDLTPVLPDYVAVDDGFARFDKSTKTDFFTTLSEDSHQDDRTECLGTIKAVQDLILQYEGMDDDDKSKMSGVKEYLENQLNFLNKKISNQINPFKLYQKRELSRIKRNSHEKPKKYIKNFSKKHTRTTFNDYVTDRHEDNIIINKNIDNNINNDLGVKLINSKLTTDDIKKS